MMGLGWVYVVPVLVLGLPWARIGLLLFAKIPSIFDVGLSVLGSLISQGYSMASRDCVTGFVFTST